MPAHDLFGTIAFDRLRGCIPGQGPALRIEHANRIVLDSSKQQAKTLFALAQGFLRVLPAQTFRGFPQCPMDRRGEIGKLVLKNVIRSATLEGFDRRLFAQRSRDENEWNIGRLFFGQNQRAKAVEGGQAMIGKDQIGGITLQVA